MFSLDSQDKIRKWIIWFLIKLNFLVLGSFFLFDGLINQSPLITLISLIFLSIGGYFTYRDIKTDPYNILKLFKSQFLLYWRLRGPIISRQPYYYHFPEGAYLQKTEITRTIRVSSEKLQTGTSLTTNTRVPIICPICHGKRNKELTVQIECKICQGGKKYLSIGTGTLPIPCKECLGTGWVPIQPCPHCQGKGVVWKIQNIRLYIPSNAFQGMKLRIPKLGKIDPKTLEQGDLYFKLRKKFLNFF